MNINAFDEVRKIWSNTPKSVKAKNITFDINVHKKLLEIIQPGTFCYFVVNVRKSLLEVVSPEIEQMIGYSLGDIDVSFYVNCIHPDDLPFFLNFEVAVEKFFKQLPPDKLFKYKVQYDYRLRKADGNYIRVLHQFVVIQHDAEDVKTFAIDTDITHLKKEILPVLSFIGLEGEPSYYNVDIQNVFKPSKQLFTKREHEILKALVQGMNSLEIGEALSISKLTVDSHRKNILKKANAKSTPEIVRMAFDNGWV